MVSIQKEQRKKRIRDFLLTFFDKDEYTEKKVNGFMLVKSWDGDNECWRVGIYTKDSFGGYKQYQEGLL